jgi:predicted nucleic acid-binding protein
VILLDTNVVSEPLKPKGDPAVRAWLDAQIVETLHLSIISVAELRYGLAILPEGKRKDDLCTRLESQVLAAFGSRILHFDGQAADAYASLRARARSQGLAIGMADALIAATAASRALTVATRDTAPFEAAGVAVINPWNHKK